MLHKNNALPFAIAACLPSATESIPKVKLVCKERAFVQVIIVSENELEFAHFNPLLGFSRFYQHYTA